MISIYFTYYYYIINNTSQLIITFLFIFYTVYFWVIMHRIETLIKNEENGLIFKRNYKFAEAFECFDSVLKVATDSKIHAQWRTEV